MSRQLALWEAEERKLQPVFDDVASHRLAPASSALTRYLKKHPKSQPALIIKMYITHKMKGEEGEEEAMKIFREVMVLGGKGKEMTGRGVWWVTLTLRQMGKLALAQKIYQDLYALHPQAHQLLEQVFLHASAANDVPTMVEASRKMFNTTKEARWAMTAGWAEWYAKAPQPSRSVGNGAFPDEVEDKNALKVAGLLVGMAGQECETSEQFWLRSQILLSSGPASYPTILKLAREQAADGSLARVWHRMEVVKEVLKRSGSERQNEWEEERQWAAWYLEEEDTAARNYAYYQYLLHATALSTDPEAVGKTVNLLENLEKEIGSKERAPALALLSIDSVLQELAQKGEAISNDAWPTRAASYWAQWSAKGSIISEVEGFTAVNSARKEKVYALVQQSAKKEASNEKEFKEKVHAETLLLRAQPASWVPQEDDVEKWWALYKAGLDYGRNLPPTDVQPADEAGLISVNLLLTIWSSSSSDEKPLWKAISRLEEIVEKSPVCMYARYLLIRLYRLVGAPLKSLPHLTKLSLSEIQLDNLLHVFTERGGAGEAVLSKSDKEWKEGGLVEKATGMYKRTAVEFPEYVKDALSNESYSKIPSIKYLHSALASSLSHRALLVERASHHLLSAPSGRALPKELVKGLKKAVQGLEKGEKSENLRNWELVYEIGGSLPLVRDITELSPSGRVSDAWLNVLSQFWLNVAEFQAGGKVQDITISQGEALEAAEQALVEVGGKVLSVVDAALKGEEKEGGLAGVFDNLAASFTAPKQPHSVNLTLTSLLTLLPVVDLAFSRLAEVAKPQKGKNKSAYLGELVLTLRKARDQVKKRGLEIVAEIETREPGVEVREGDKALVEGIEKARKEVLVNFKGLFK
ncbi:hypothetical protein L202_04793 [Cryptococcus amylolentus CBS 6039]|uniref:Uncharacterized protein n=2 Tax=Cryptococcus amylolentus TaxID=104669 RepID=A0A1E3HNB9_9TREE|nr:hypothetical protein L202_04793 [Cryptococcus amylolentus CBS 6039]ODN77635.1 hypothetical protein L202_04793 [Cryptococcus amylolentus CBS 6039]ODO05660.1 hypothetical protein I350_04719 [Cryptococcus amylolentus CBS 6273]